MQNHFSEPKKKGFNDIYQILVQGAPDIILIVQAGRVCFANPAASRMLGYTIEELCQMPLVDLVAPEDQALVRRLSASSRTRQDAAGYEIALLGRSGPAALFDIRCSAMRFEDQPAVQLVAHDVTRQRLETEHIVQSEKMGALARFVSAFAHELNNPLTVIAGFAEILLSNMDLNDRDRGDLQMIADETKRARQMVHDVLRLSREQPMEPQSIDLNQLIRTTIDRQQTDGEANAIGIITDLASDLPRLAVDPQQMGQAISQIISHIRRSLAAKVEAGTIRIRTTVEQIPFPTAMKRVLEVTFAIEGLDRSQDDLRQMFEPVYTTKEADQGLGLALSYNLIKQHEGRLSVLGSPAGGVQIIIDLPYAGS